MSLDNSSISGASTLHGAHQASQHRGGEHRGGGGRHPGPRGQEADADGKPAERNQQIVKYHQMSYKLHTRGHRHPSFPRFLVVADLLQNETVVTSLNSAASKTKTEVALLSILF